MAATLFPDFDGGLNADPVFLMKDVPTLDPDYGTLFEWAPIQVSILADFPETEIVLSASWAAHFGLMGTVQRMPADLTPFVTDLVWDKHAWLDHGISAGRFHKMTRYEQIHQYVMRKKLARWVAVDNDAYGWPDHARHYLVQTADMRGLSDRAAQADLRGRLTNLICARASRLMLQ